MDIENPNNFRERWMSYLRTLDLEALTRRATPRQGLSFYGESIFEMLNKEKYKKERKKIFHPLLKSTFKNLGRKKPNPKKQ